MQMSATRKINVIIYLHRFVENHYKSHSDHFFLQKNNAFCLNKYTRERKNSSLNVNGHEIEGKKAKQFLWVNDKWMLTAGLFPNPYSSVIPNMTSISHPANIWLIFRYSRLMAKNKTKYALSTRKACSFQRERHLFIFYFHTEIRKLHRLVTALLSVTLISILHDRMCPGYYYMMWRRYHSWRLSNRDNYFFSVGVRCFRGKKKSKLSQNGQKERKSQTDLITARMYVNQYV